MDLELRHLRILCAIADLGSVGRAAAAAGTTQPAMSTQLRRIEKIFDQALFLRGGNGMQLTPHGVHVVAQARDLLARADALGRYPAPPTVGTLRLGATNLPALPGFLARLRAACPDLAVTLHSEYNIAALVHLLETGRLDVVLGADYPGHELAHSPALACRAVVTEPVFVALSAEHRLAHHPEIPLAALADDAWFVSPDDGAGWPGVLHDAFRAAGFTPVTVHEVTAIDQLQAMVSQGMGVTAIQPTARATDRMLIKPMTGDPLWFRHLLIWRRDGPAAEVADSLHHYVTGAYRDLIAHTPHYQAWAARNYAVPRP
ncbi:transcriptional regulator [Longispora fulva]|uniref:DNA-binding transcriptional LysR family regulator n=1 Tax=Longispora fulva TaxID=619741 RepID=A0A8J7GF79_9ACTN|nr:LysR family transcriptional regulator [Longispora fulva]MBG6136795.1 DNA-binding transcriptional LysR family regulator [Longispora fulva]GIG59966.1 transcriptional regulator [Longispora fulva]